MRTGPEELELTTKKKRDKKGKSVNGGKMKGHEEGNG